MRCALLAAVAVSACVTAVLPAQTVSDNRLRVETWASGLSAPTTFTWIGPDEMLVIQKDDGKVKWIKDGVVQGTALDLTVQHDSERGGLGIAADPDFANNGWVYIYYSTTSAAGDSTTSSRWVDNRVERYDWNGSTLANPFGPLVAFPTDASQSNGPNHDGGVIRFGPDGMLYGQTGDLNRGRFGGGKERVEQNTAMAGSASVGGIFRLMNDGSIPGDNPFVTESDAAFHLWWSYGLRNGFGMTWDELTGTLWNTENGPNVYDEVGPVPFAGNSGWLKIMGPDSRDATYSENGNSSFDATDLTYLDNAVYVDPALSFLNPVGITAISFLHTKRFPADLRDDCIFADNNLGNLYFVEMKVARDGFKLPSGLGDKVVDNTTERDKIKWGTGWAAATDIQVGADGYVYVASIGGGKIVRIRPVTDTVEPRDLAFLPGTVFVNDRENIEASDDRYYIAQERGRSRNPPPYTILARFVLNDASPTSVVLELEDRFPQRDGFRQDLYVKNVGTGAWDMVDSAILGRVDVLRSITLASPTQYVDPTALTVEVRVNVEPPAISLIRPPINIAIDLFQLAVTYP